MRSLLIAAALALFAAPALAGDETPTQPPDDDSIAVSPVALPVVVDKQVVNYVFVTVKILLTPRADEFGLRDKEPFFRDALVRDAYRNPFVIKTDYNHLDENKLKAALYHDAVAIAGPAAIRGIQVVSQTPQHFLPPPRPVSH